MDIEKILSSGLINTAELARMIWPDINPAGAKVRMHQKINMKNKQRLTKSDLILIENYLKNILK